MEGRAAEDVFKDFRGRRAGLIRALTTDVRKFYDKCDPGELYPPALILLCFISQSFYLSSSLRLCVPCFLI
ncbi:hypothetical protein YC2023_070112 [Brassica napus]